MCALEMDFPVKWPEKNATMARKNNLVLYKEVYRLMIKFFIYKDDVFQISEIF